MVTATNSSVIGSNLGIFVTEQGSSASSLTLTGSNFGAVENTHGGIVCRDACTIDLTGGEISENATSDPAATSSTFHGGVWMGMGQALQEETQYHDGLALRPNFLDYRIPTIAESPPIDVHLVESRDPLGPFGAKEASEGALHGFPPALTNAIADAIGIRLQALPATPDRVLDAIHDQRRAERLAAARARRS